MDYIITFTDVDDARFPGRHILIGEVAGCRYFASYNNRRDDAVLAIRRKFAAAYAAAGSDPQ